MRQEFVGNSWTMSRLLCPILLAGICGCGNSADVAGKISYRGRPVVYGSVIFVDGDRAAHSAAIQADGSYLVEGIPPGSVSVAVISRNPALGRPVLQSEKSVSTNKDSNAARKTVTGWFPLPREYENPKTSGLDCEVGKGHCLHDIDLK